LRVKFIRIAYYVLYSLVLFFCFVLIPFAYFYYEEDDEDITLGQKIWAGCKYTIFLLIIVIVLLVVGIILAVVQPAEKPTKDNAKQWISDLLKTTPPEAAVSFAIASLTTIGFVSWISYTAYGLTAFPIGIIRGRKHVTEDANDLQSDLESTREKKRKLKSKYLGGKRISRKDESTLNLLDRKEKVLSRQGQRLEASSCWRTCYTVSKPFLFIFGIVFLLVSIVIWVSILLTTIDKTVNQHQICESSAACGFVLSNREIFNPVDVVLTKAAKFFPLDYVIVALLVIYIFIATLSGIVKISIRFLWMKLYDIRRGGSAPQGLLLAAVILILSTLALNFEITTLAPQYSTFGTQVYNVSMLNATVGGNGTVAGNGTVVVDNRGMIPCDLKSPQANCTMTQIAQIVNRVSIRTAFFGVIYFYATWVFLVFCVLGSFVALFKARASNIEKREDDSDEEEY